MITTKYNTTTVTFGKDGIGTIGLIGKRGAMTMQQLINECEIGKPFDMAKDVSELPKVILEFNEISSINKN